MTDEELLCDVAATFVRLADTLVDDYDVVEFASMLSQETKRLLEVDAVGVMLVAGPDDLRVFASSCPDARVLELIQLEVDEGPAIEAYRTGVAVHASDLGVLPSPWGRFAPFAVDCGYSTASALPMWVRQNRIGVLSLFDRLPRRLSDENISLAGGLADIASIGILSARKVREEHVLAEQLQQALTSRVVIEQAKGALAERLGLHVDDAFAAMRHHARSHQRHLSEVAHDVVDGRFDADDLLVPPSS